MNQNQLDTAPRSADQQQAGYALGDRLYFLAEVVRLREMWGMRKFWLEPERALRAFGGLFYVWLHTENAKPSDATVMEATKSEFDRRLRLSSGSTLFSGV